MSSPSLCHDQICKLDLVYTSAYHCTVLFFMHEWSSASISWNCTTQIPHTFLWTVVNMLKINSNPQAFISDLWAASCNLTGELIQVASAEMDVQFNNLLPFFDSKLHIISQLSFSERSQSVFCAVLTEVSRVCSYFHCLAPSGFVVWLQQQIWLQIVMTAICSTLHD